MLENTGRATAAPNPPPRSNVEYFTIRLAALEGGLVGVALEATTFDEEELALQSQDIGSSRVATIDDALAFVRQNVAFN